MLFAEFPSNFTKCILETKIFQLWMTITSVPCIAISNEFVFLFLMIAQPGYIAVLRIHFEQFVMFDGVDVTGGRELWMTAALWRKPFTQITERARACPWFSAIVSGTQLEGLGGIHVLFNTRATSHIHTCQSLPACKMSKNESLAELLFYVQPL